MVMTGWKSNALREQRVMYQNLVIAKDAELTRLRALLGEAMIFIEENECDDCLLESDKPESCEECGVWKLLARIADAVKEGK